MQQCQNCGQVNNYGSNFCRFCGTRMVISQNPILPTPPIQQNQTPYEYNPPRPYIWKTDEFQLPDAVDKKTRQINQVQPLAPLAPFQPPRPAAPPPAPFYQTQNQQPLTNYGYRCPSCGTQHLPLATRKISTVGWIVFAVLLIVFFPLFWIGFLIKEDVRICPVCTMRVA